MSSKHQKTGFETFKFPKYILRFKRTICLIHFQITLTYGTVVEDDPEINIIVKTIGLIIARVW